MNSDEIKHKPEAFYDPIWDVVRECQEDPREHKIELITGQIRYPSGAVTSDAVMQAARLEQQDMRDFASVPAEGDTDKLAQLLEFISPSLSMTRPMALHTPGATGGLFATLSWLKHSCGIGKMYLSDPTWPNHIHIAETIGIEQLRYDFSEPDSDRRNKNTVKDLAAIQGGECVIFQPCCHNPTGQSLSDETWETLANHIARVGAVALFDASYIGWSGDGIERDIWPVKLFVERGCAVIMILSGSKLFGLYSARIGAAFIFNFKTPKLNAALVQANAVIRAAWTSPNAFGLSIISRVLSDKALCKRWDDEMRNVKSRMESDRKTLADLLDRFGRESDTVRKGKGVFAILPFSQSEIRRLKNEFGVYLLENGRMSFGRLFTDNQRQRLWESLAMVAAKSSLDEPAVVKLH